MVSIMWIGLIVALLVLNTGCSSRNASAPSVHTYSVNDLVALAPYIVIGKVTSVEDTRNQKSAKVNGVVAAPVTVALLVQQSLRGSLQGTIAFTGYRANERQPPVKQMSAPPAGTGGIFFLTRDESGYSAFNGVYASHIPLCLSGEVQRLPTGTSMHQIVAAVVLQQRKSGGECADSLSSRVETAKDLVGRVKGSQMLRQTLRESSGELWVEACLVLSRSFYGQDDCLEKSLDFVNPDQVKDVQAQMQSNRRRDEAFLKHLSANAFISQYANQEQPDDERDLLVHLMSHRNPQIAQIAFNVFRERSR